MPSDRLSQLQQQAMRVLSIANSTQPVLLFIGQPTPRRQWGDGDVDDEGDDDEDDDDVVVVLVVILALLVVGGKRQAAKRSPSSTLPSLPILIPDIMFCSCSLSTALEPWADVLFPLSISFW